MNKCIALTPRAVRAFAVRIRSLTFAGLALGLFAPVEARCEDLNRTSAHIRRLEKQVLELQTRMEQMQQQQQRQLDALQEQLRTTAAPQLADAMTAEGAVPAVTPSPPISTARAGTAYMNMSFSSAMVGGYSTEPKPAELLELGDHDPQKRGFSLRNAEIALNGSVDPYFKGFANIVLKLDENDETDIELEESYLQTTSLPANLQVKAGQFFANFGRQNPQHPHQWAFVDQPLVLNRAFGPDGLRNIGTQISWLAPTPFYSEASLGVLDSQGGTAFNFRNPGDDSGAFHGRMVQVNELRGPGDLLVVPRLAASFDVSDSQTVLTGLSGAFAPNSSQSGSRSQIYGADVYWKWKPENANSGFPFVSWQTEGLYTNYEAAAAPEAEVPLPAETLHDYGVYSQLGWGFAERWVAGFRGDYVNGNNSPYDEFDPVRGRRFRLSPVLTFLPSEFSKIRLQYNYDDGETFGSASSYWLQLEFNLGAHAAHKF